MTALDRRMCVTRPCVGHLPVRSRRTPCAPKQGWVELYRGEEKQYKATKLMPGVRYTFRLRVGGCWACCCWGLQGQGTQGRG